jgi:hypothetical protein
MQSLRTVLPLLLAVLTFSPIEYERALVLRVEEQMKNSPSTTVYSYKGNGWFEFTNEDGRTWFRNFADTRAPGGLKPKKIISIDLRKIDTTGFSRMFNDIAIVPLGTSSRPPVGSRISGKDGCELTGQYFQQGAGYDDIRMFTRASPSMIFHQAHIYSTVFATNGSADIDRNGLMEIVGDSLGSIVTFEGSSSGQLDMQRKYFWRGMNGSEQVPRIFDLDGDGYPELIQRQFGNGYLGPVILKYDAVMNRLINPFRLTYPGDPDFRGYWAVGDFDMDEKKEFVTATRDGQVHFVEHDNGDSAYSIVFTDTTRYINAFFHIEGNDLDGDGRPECFVGSDDTGGLNNIAVYETTGDNRFEVTAWIELFPLGSFMWEMIWTGDVTGDGKDEIVLSSAGALLVLKAFGDDDWRLIWFKDYQTEIAHRLYDVDNDGANEILLSMRDGVSRYTRILKYNTINAIQELSAPNESAQMTIYPQPADNGLFISIKSREMDLTEIKLYTIEGAMVKRASNVIVGASHLPQNIPTSSLKNGIYIVVLEGNGIRIAKKCVILHD